MGSNPILSAICEHICELETEATAFCGRADHRHSPALRLPPRAPAFEAEGTTVLARDPIGGTKRGAGHRRCRTRSVRLHNVPEGAAGEVAHGGHLIERGHRIC